MKELDVTGKERSAARTVEEQRAPLDREIIATVVPMADRAATARKVTVAERRPSDSLGDLEAMDLAAASLPDATLPEGIEPEYVWEERWAIVRRARILNRVFACVYVVLGARLALALVERAPGGSPSIPLLTPVWDLLLAPFRVVMTGSAGAAIVGVAFAMMVYALLHESLLAWFKVRVSRVSAVRTPDPFDAMWRAARLHDASRHVPVGRAT